MAGESRHTAEASNSLTAEFIKIKKVHTATANAFKTEEIGLLRKQEVHREKKLLITQQRLDLDTLNSVKELAICESELELAKTREGDMAVVNGNLEDTKAALGNKMDKLEESMKMLAGSVEGTLDKLSALFTRKDQ